MLALSDVGLAYVVLAAARLPPNAAARYPGSATVRYVNVGLEKPAGSRRCFELARASSLSLRWLPVYR